MRAHTRRAVGALGASLALLIAAGCGGSSGDNNPAGAQETGNPVKGGTLNMLGPATSTTWTPTSVLLLGGYLSMRLWSRQLFSYPAESGQTTTTAPDIATELPTEANGGISPDKTTYTIKLRDDVMWNSSPARPVVGGRLRARRPAHVQPGPAVRGHPRLRHADRGLPGLL